MPLVPLNTRIAISLALVILLISAGTVAAAEAQPVEATARGLEIFQKHVRLVLAHNCVSCHGGDATESELDMTTREGLLAGGAGGKVVEPGSAEQSRLVKLIRHELEPKMPEEADKLSAEAIASIVDWIDLGAPYDKPLVDEEEQAQSWTETEVPAAARDFWSFQPLARVEPPPVKNEAWCRTPIDRFILAGLEEKGIAPSQPAERRTLIRRAYFDLLGLPPTSDEVEAFLRDMRPDAYAKLIDRLLDSPHYGERWGRHWLDVARFAESHGFEQDYDRKFAYHFRDFVIQALNQDMPYDTFVRWQLAGDELEPDKPLAMMATGFLGAGVFPTQITANEVERTRYDALDDMAATMGTAMLGLTVGCARCHDHKFDPIPQADYYRLISTFSTTVRSEIDLDFNPEIYRKAKEKFDREHAPLAAELEKFERDDLADRFAQWEKGRPQDAPLPWLILEPAEFKSASGAKLTRLDDGSLLAGGTNPDFDTYTVVARSSARPITAVRLEALPDATLTDGGPGRAKGGKFALGEFRLSAAPVDAKAPPVEVLLTSAWQSDVVGGKPQTAVFETQPDLGFEDGTALTFTLQFKKDKGHNLGRLRLAVTSAPRPVALDRLSMPEAVANLLAAPREKRDAAATAALVAWYRTIDPEWQRLRARVDEFLARAPKPNLTTVMVCSEGLKPIRHHSQGADFFEKTYFLRRGSTDNKESEAAPSYLQVLMKSPEGAKHWRLAPPAGWRTSYRRGSLAGWITDTQYGAGELLARVMANRLWHHHLGRGIVATPSDFGQQGQRPTHPELLDWLAARLIDGGWRLKAMHKLIMTSAVYVQNSEFDPNQSAADLDEQLVWRYAPRRLEAEIVRDAMLAASGTLDRRMFGPGTLDESHNRRSIYFMIKRSKLIPMMQLFDAPEPLVSIGNRPSTTTAPQALVFMNNPNVRRYASNFAKQLAAAGSTAEAVRQGYLTALAREPTERELADSLDFIEQQIKSYEERRQTESRQLALADFCQVLFGLNEFIYVQ